MENLEIGKIYDVVHERKGKFTMELTHHDDAFATGIIVKGKAKAILPYNELGITDEVTILKSFSTFKEVISHN
jgi:hypothetical protein